jgi:predicted dithiol-disulfide oxidoreductase (DUF899 family)
LFDSPKGKEILADLFAGRSQLAISHFMLGPAWNESCVGCSFRPDHVAGALVHLENHDVSLVTVPRAAFRNRSLSKTDGLELQMGFVSRNRCNYDYSRLFQPG